MARTSSHWRRDCKNKTDFEFGTTDHITNVYYMDLVNAYERMGDYMIKSHE